MDTSTSKTTPTDLSQFQGLLYLVALDIGDDILLDKARAALELSGIVPRATPQIGLKKPSIEFDDPSSLPTIDVIRVERVVITLYHYGTVSVRFEIPCSLASNAELQRVVRAMRGSTEALIADARARVGRVMKTLGRAIRRPAFSVLYEDYLVFCDARSSGATQAEQPMDHAAVAQALQLEIDALSADRVELSLQHRLTWGLNDQIVVAWNGAYILNCRTALAVVLMEYRNAQLLATRVLTAPVDAERERANRDLQRPFWSIASPRGVMSLHADALYLFDDLRFALGQLRDQYLADLDKMLRTVLELGEAEESIATTLTSTGAIRDTLYSRASGLRMEVLTIVIILQILYEIFYK